MRPAVTSETFNSVQFTHTSGSGRTVRKNYKSGNVATRFKKPGLDGAVKASVQRLHMSSAPNIFRLLFIAWGSRKLQAIKTTT